MLQKGEYSVLATIRDPSFPFSSNITEIGLLSTEENGIIVARQRYNKVKKIFNLHYNALTNKEFEILSYFYHNECNYGTTCFLWRYPVLTEDNNVRNAGNLYQGKIFYVRVTKFSFKAITYNLYRGDIVLSEV